MSTNISSSSIRDIYKQILRIATNNIDATEKAVGDADGNDSALKISSNSIRSTGRAYIDNPTAGSEGNTVFLVHDPNSKEVKTRTIESIAPLMSSLVSTPATHNSQTSQSISVNLTKINLTSNDNFGVNSDGIMAINNNEEIEFSAGYYRVQCSLEVYDATTNSPHIFSTFNKSSNAQVLLRSSDQLVNNISGTSLDNSVIVNWTYVVKVTADDVTNSTNRYEIKMQSTGDGTSSIYAGQVQICKIADVSEGVTTVNEGLTPAP